MVLDGFSDAMSSVRIVFGGFLAASKLRIGLDMFGLVFDVVSPKSCQKHNCCMYSVQRNQ